MTVYKRSDSNHYSYEFQLDGRRYSGPTGTSDIEEAKEFEKQVRDDVSGMSILCRSVLRKASRKRLSIRNVKYGYVYMIKSGYFIKIGHSNDPSSRIRSISTATPDDCEMLFCIPGAVELERRLHQEFASCHYKKEWFFLCGKLKAFVTEFQRDFANETEYPTRFTVSSFPSEISA